MRAIINPYISETGWQEEFLPGWSLCALPLVGKPFADHLIDLCSLLHIDSVLVLDYNYDHEFGKNLTEGQRWALTLEYEGSVVMVSASKMISQHKRFFADEDVLIFQGSVLPMLSSADELLAELEPAEGDYLTDGIYVWRQGELMRSKAPVKVIDSIRCYYDMNFELMRSPGLYVLPGYSAENSVFLGMNVAIMSDVDIRPPIMLCDDCCIERGCQLNGGVIVGRNVLVDRETVLKHSIILDHTYVGMKMELEGKIVASGRIIDPINEIHLDMDDLGIAADTRYYEKWDWMRCVEYLLALMLVILFAVPYLVYLPFSHWMKNRLWKYKLSLDRYPKLLLTLVGKGRLVKSLSTPKLPFAFCASDMFSLLRAPWQQKLDDTYYEHHRSISLIIIIIIKGLIYRSFINVIPGPDSW